MQHRVVQERGIIQGYIMDTCADDLVRNGGFKLIIE